MVVEDLSKPNRVAKPLQAVALRRTNRQIHGEIHECATTLIANTTATHKIRCELVNGGFYYPALVDIIGISDHTPRFDFHFKVASSVTVPGLYDLPWAASCLYYVLSRLLRCRLGSACTKSNKLPIRDQTTAGEAVFNLEIDLGPKHDGLSASLVKQTAFWFKELHENPFKWDFPALSGNLSRVAFCRNGKELRVVDLKSQKDI